MRQITGRAFVRFVCSSAVLLVLGIVLLGMPAGTAAQRDPLPTPAAGRDVASPTPAFPAGWCQDGVQASGAKYSICMPAPVPWNHELVVYAHGYVDPNRPVELPQDQLKLGTVYISDTVNMLGYAFATTSYSVNGLAVQQGLADLVDLVNIFKQRHPQVTRVYLAGVSEGGLVTTLAIERYPEVFDGGLAMCGPVGDFRAQTDYFGDFRAVFDYFFPDLLPGSAISVPQALMDGWSDYYAANVLPVISDPPSAISVTQLLSVTQAAYDPLLPESTISSTVAEVLWYDVFAVNDAAAKLGGQPYDNRNRGYSGSLDDQRLNEQVSRYDADAAALAEIEARYQPTGRLQAPLVTLHNTLDPVVPYWHEPLYRDKVVAQHRTGWYVGLPPVERYGHCAFTLAEVQQALTVLQRLVSVPLTPPSHVEISGPATGITGIPYTLAASCSPLTATTPITYTWSPDPDSGQGTANVSYSWPVSGEKTIMVMAENVAGYVTGTHTIVLSEARTIRLPWIVKSYGAGAR